MPRPEKVQAVEEITARFNEADAALLTEYRGLKVSEMAEVRSALREADAEYKILKNTLARIAVREVGVEELAEMLVGPTGIVFAKGDVAAAAKALDDVAKKFPVLVIKGGIVQGKIIDADQTKALASLEPREVQLAKIAMMMNAPAQQTVNVFAALLRNFGSMLAQVLQKKESGELPGGAGEPVAETPAEAAPGTPEEQPGPAETEEGGDTAPETDGDTDTGDAPEPGTPAEQPGPEAAADPAPEPDAESDPAPEADAAATPEAADQADAAPESEAAEDKEVDESSS